MSFVVSPLMKALVNSGTCGDFEEAFNLIVEMQDRVLDGENPEEVLYEYGLEPDYVFELLPV